MNVFVTNKKNQPVIFFHSTNHAFDEAAFMPFSHFGTCQAANIRWVGKGYRLEDARIIPALLKIKNPLLVKDSGDSDIYFGVRELFKIGISSKQIEWIYQPLLTRPMDREHFLNEARLAHSYSDFVPESIGGLFGFKEASLVNAVQPITHGDIIEEFNNEGLYPFKIQTNQFNSDDLPTLRRLLKDQRKILLLESMGYDGLVYENEEEDAGSTTYCIFRPSQVSSPYEYDWGPAGFPETKVDFNHYRMSWVGLAYPNEPS